MVHSQQSQKSVNTSDQQQSQTFDSFLKSEGVKHIFKDQIADILREFQT